MRVLLLAYECNPDWPSLPVVAYKYALALANYVEVVLVTQILNKPNIEREGTGKAEVVYLDIDKIQLPIERLAVSLRGGKSVGWTIQMAMNYPIYLAFEWAAWRYFQEELKQGQFDIVHRITPMSPTLPSPMAEWSPVPFVLGPLNGGLPWPRQFTAEMSREREWLSYFRNAYRFLPYYRSTYSRAASILAAFDHTIADLPTAATPKIINFPEVGIDPTLFDRTNRTVGDRLTILFVGRLVPYKLPEVVVQAFARSNVLQQHRLLIVGEGPERPRLEQLVTDRQLEDCVEFAGKKTQAEVGELMRQSEILAFPSIRELGAGVVVEAMSCGMACVVVDYGGSATLIDGDRGVKIPLGPFGYLVDRFVEELEKLVSNPDRVKQLGDAAYSHAATYYSWDTKAQKTVEIYDWLIKKQENRPNFWAQRSPALSPSQSYEEFVSQRE